MTPWPNKSRWLLFCSAVPWLVLSVLVSVALHLRFGLGHWPRPCWDQYHSTAFAVHFSSFALLMMFSTVFSVPMFICFFVDGSSRFRLRGHLVQPLIYVLGWIAFILFCVYDPTRFVFWLWD